MIPCLDPKGPIQFPNTSTALEEPNGLLAAGGLLTTDWLIAAYKRGIFPWFNENEPILWWSPAPRTVLNPKNLRINRSFAKFLRKKTYRITRDTRFREVIEACAEPRQGQVGSWISLVMIDAYTELFKSGYAHSYECWDDNNVLVGGLYGVAIGQMFFGESMFSHAPNASKCCLKALVDSQQYQLIDCQMETEYLLNMGAKSINRKYFEDLILQYSHINI